MKTCTVTELKSQAVSTTRWMYKTLGIKCTVEKAVPTSETTGYAILDRVVNKKKIFMWYYKIVRSGENGDVRPANLGWSSIMLTYDHIAGLHGVHVGLQEVELHNSGVRRPNNGKK